MSERELESLSEHARWSTTWLKVTFLPMLCSGTCRLWVDSCLSTCPPVHRFSALRAALMVWSARIMNSLMSFEDFLSELGEINIFRIFRFSSSCSGPGLTDLLLAQGELVLEATEERLNTEGFLSPNFSRKFLCGAAVVVGERLQGVTSSRSAVSEAKDICGVR